MKQLIIGIDPGLDGAIAIINVNGKDVKIIDTPTLVLRAGKKKKREYDYAGIVEEIIPLCGRGSHIYLEKIHSMPGQGVKSMFSMGEGFGMWKGIIAALRISSTLVTPQAWKKTMMAGMPKEKDASRLRALQLFPNMHEQLKKKKDHNRADALLIAEYGRRLTA